MSDRDQFEAWSAKHQTMDGYAQYTAFDAWQASRRSALEEAANACLVATPDAAMRKALGDAAHYVACAKAVRALATGDTHE